ncbi:hypothetical protein E3203_00545 [Oecophyllibacter saccharovorans]|nr:hypothetical protein E3203_00545 [Oecophyllibacter saccharovorans]
MPGPCSHRAGSGRGHAHGGCDQSGFCACSAVRAEIMPPATRCLRSRPRSDAARCLCRDCPGRLARKQAPTLGGSQRAMRALSSEKSFLSRPMAEAGLLVLGVLLAPSVSSLASAAAPEISWPSKLIDPHPLPDDLVLPLPCGGAMAFRAVDVPLPTETLLADRPITLGAPTPQEGYSQFTLQTWLSAPFKPQGKGEQTQKMRRYYLAKYDVTRNQYTAVMEGTKGHCPAAPTLTSPSGGQKPQTSISWNEAQDFLALWTSWLLKNAPQTLPQHQGTPGFLRLPTDAEWGYAARGGAKVSPEGFQQPMWPLPDGALKEDYIVAGAQDGLQKIGSKKPNPLGLYDMLGEVDQMLQEPYRLHHGERLQGQAGGLQLRGGNYLAASADELSTATRSEAPAYNVRTGEPTRQVTTGIRVAIGANALDSPQAVTQAEKEFQALYAHYAQQAARNSPAAQSLLTSMSAHATDAAGKAELARIKAQLAAEAQKREETEQLAVHAQLEALMALGGNIGELDHVASFIATQLEQLSKAAPGQDLSQARANLARRRAQIRVQSEAYAELIRSMIRQLPDRDLLAKAAQEEKTALQQAGRTDSLPLLSIALEDLQQTASGHMPAPEEIARQFHRDTP